MIIDWEGGAGYLRPPVVIYEHGDEIAARSPLRRPVGPAHQRQQAPSGGAAATKCFICWQTTHRLTSSYLRGSAVCQGTQPEAQLVPRGRGSSASHGPPRVGSPSTHTHTHAHAHAHARTHARTSMDKSITHKAIYQNKKGC